MARFVPVFQTMLCYLDRNNPAGRSYGTPSATDRRFSWYDEMHDRALRKLDEMGYEPVLGRGGRSDLFVGKPGQDDGPTCSYHKPWTVVRVGDRRGVPEREVTVRDGNYPQWLTQVYLLARKKPGRKPSA